MLVFDQVAFRYKRDGGKGLTQTAPILEEVSFSLKPGELIGLVGPNGSGKSTIARLAAGILLPSQGQITVDGIPTDEVEESLARKIGIVFQDPDHQMVGTTVAEDLAFGLENLGVPDQEMEARVVEIAAAFGLTRLLALPIHELSGGMKQKVALAGVMILQPTFLLLDEPTAHLDPWARRDLWKMLGELRDKAKVGLLIISHDTRESQRYDRLLVLYAGRIAFDGPPNDLWNHPERTAWGIAVPEGVRFSATSPSSCV